MRGMKKRNATRIRDRTTRGLAILCTCLAMLLAGLCLCAGICSADEGGRHPGGAVDDYEPVDEHPDIDAGDNETAIIGYTWARFGLILVKMIGMIVAVWGILEFGTSVYHHDPSVRTQGILGLATGISLTLLGTILSEWGIFG